MRVIELMNIDKAESMGLYYEKMVGDIVMVLKAEDKGCIVRTELIGDIRENWEDAKRNTYNSSNESVIYQDGIGFIVTNKEMEFGAGLIVCDETIAEVQKRVGKNFFMLPSSRHEVIVLPYDEKVSLAMLSKLVSEVNASCVNDDDFLSNNAYLYYNGEWLESDPV